MCLLQDGLVQLQLIKQIEICARLGHVALYNRFHALLLQQIAFIIEAILIRKTRQRFIDQRCGIDHQLRICIVVVLKQSLTQEDVRVIN